MRLALIRRPVIIDVRLTAVERQLPGEPYGVGAWTGDVVGGGARRQRGVSKRADGDLRVVPHRQQRRPKACPSQVWQLPTVLSAVPAGSDTEQVLP
jgi:hypothetical protein